MGTENRENSFPATRFKTYSCRGAIGDPFSFAVAESVEMLGECPNALRRSVSGAAGFHSLALSMSNADRVRVRVRDLLLRRDKFSYF